jgi:hypothetical protein
VAPHLVSSSFVLFLYDFNLDMPVASDMVDSLGVTHVHYNFFPIGYCRYSSAPVYAYRAFLVMAISITLSEMMG